MIRNILGFAVMALVAIVVFKVALALLGVVLGLTVSVLALATMGYLFYLVLCFVSPKTAARVQEVIKGSPVTS
jgi:hypothetical protein